MPKYYFDLIDGNHTSSDDEGQDFPSLAAAQAEAQYTLADVACDALRTANFTTTKISVRDEAGRVAIRMGLKLDIEKAAD